MRPRRSPGRTLAPTCSAKPVSCPRHRRACSRPSRRRASSCRPRCRPAPRGRSRRSTARARPLGVAGLASCASRRSLQLALAAAPRARPATGSPAAASCAGAGSLGVGLVLRGLQLAPARAGSARARRPARCAAPTRWPSAARPRPSAPALFLLALRVRQPIQRRARGHVSPSVRQHLLDAPGLGGVELHRAQRLDAGAQRHLVVEGAGAHGARAAPARATCRPRGAPRPAWRPRGAAARARRRAAASGGARERQHAIHRAGVRGLRGGEAEAVVMRLFIATPCLWRARRAARPSERAVRIRTQPLSDPDTRWRTAATLRTCAHARRLHPDPRRRPRRRPGRAAAAAAPRRAGHLPAAARGTRRGAGRAARRRCCCST